jgi:hypothetical protein
MGVGWAGERKNNASKFRKNEMGKLAKINGTDFVSAMIRAAASPTAVCGSDM